MKQRSNFSDKKKDDPLIYLENILIFHWVRKLIEIICGKGQEVNGLNF
jgi:hypothetical protein